MLMKRRCFLLLHLIVLSLFSVQLAHLLQEFFFCLREIGHLVVDCMNVNEDVSFQVLEDLARLLLFANP